MSSITHSLRNSSSSVESLGDYIVNHVPYPPAHFLLTSQFPLWSSEKSCPRAYNDSEITFGAFDPIYLMTKCNPNLGKYMSVSLLYRGDFTPSETNYAICSSEIKKKVQFVNWCAGRIKCRFNYEIPKVFPNSDLAILLKNVFLYCNSSAMSEVFQRILSRFDLSFANRKHLIKLYQEGIDDELLIKNRETIKVIIGDFEEIVKETEDY
ncbi:hypothetical protein SteCoe_30693 [Stentor coeruleus]|uniref:Tubulin/FtsZ 2-layer sandwich domain-containing protein n=1 Tax=Stentor coeruleus TaxID=5963 RepID=A0A1R2B329_9CILI|nr:hypothetical protein SteCoe_30693 [Stentor coeruleus]